MEIKNSNLGTIDSQGGEVKIGDTYVTNIFTGLSQLLVEFKEQLKTIETLTSQFKVKTALDLLQELENRVIEIDHPEKNKILGKIFYLKGVCKRELSGLKIQDAAKDFIAAYKYNHNDTVIRDRACVEYLNVNEMEKSIKFADEIITTDEFNLAAWYVKAVTSDDLKSFILTIPKTLLDNYNFQLSIMQHILLTGTSNFLDDLAAYNLTLNIDFPRYKELTFNSLEAWRVAADLAINKILNQYPLSYITGENFRFQDSAFLSAALNLLGGYVEKLKDTEIKDSIVHEHFFLSYFQYLLTNDKEHIKSLKAIFPRVDKSLWFYTFCFCQVLNHNKEYETSLKYILEYEASDSEFHSAVYIFKSALFHLTGRSPEVISIFSDYLKSITIIDERNALNIINAFLNILYKKTDAEILNSQLDKIKEMSFKSEQLKSLLVITITTRYLESFDYGKIFQELTGLQDFTEFDTQCKNLIAENLNSIGKRKEAIDYLRTFINKTEVSESLRFYIVLLHEQLCDKNDQERGQYEELLELLKFWRNNSLHPDQTLLGYEHNLYTEINDLQEIEDIDAYLYKNFLTSEKYILLYLNILERRRNISRIKEVSENINWEIENEHFGVSLGMILMRTEADVEKGFQILFKLASNPHNTVARRNYFASQVLLKQQHFFKSYNEVKIGSWVTYFVGEKKIHLKIEKEIGLQKEFLGRKQGETFSTNAGFSSRINIILIHEILNDAWHLFRDIQEEAANPVNELGFESIDAPTNPEEFVESLKSQFGVIGLKEKEIKEKAFDDYFNYRIGFSEIARIVFRENYIDTYLHLTGNPVSKFTTIPSFLTKPAAENEINYALDFSSLILFYTLEKELGFTFKHRFTISFLLKNEIEFEINKLAYSASSEMTLQITPQFIRKFEIPEDFNQRKTDYLKLILEWIDNNCIIDLVTEKLNVVPKLENRERLDQMMRILVDNMCLCDREDYQLISSDTTLFLVTRKNNTIANIINPEKYLTTFYPEKCDTEFYRFLLKSNYIGININFDTLKNEFYQHLGSGQNYYNLCLENLQYTVHGNPKIIGMLSRFLKDLYIMQALSLEQKNMYAHGMLSRALYGMPRDVVIAFTGQVWLDFKLMGNLYNQVISVFKNILE